jgi:hypothetical protein
MEDPRIYDMGEQEVANTETGLSLELNNLLSIDKAGIKQKVDAVMVTIQDGWTDPLDALIMAKKGVDLFSSLEKNIRPFAEAKGAQKGLVKYSTEISEAMTGVKYDYSACGDPIYNELKEASDKASEAVKERETFLKAISKPMDIVVNEAEVYTIKPPIKTGKLGLKLEIK